ncbi:hypothetical protein D3C71_1952370 [compost metagenome]
MRMLCHLFPHVVIAVFNRNFNITIARQTFAHLLSDLYHPAFTCLKTLTLKITQDVLHLGAFNAPLKAAEVVEPLIAAGGFRGFIRR